MAATEMSQTVESVGRNLDEVVRHVRLPGADELESETGFRIDAAGAVLLARLSGQAPMRLTDLADSLGLAPSTISRQLPPLESQGLVVRQADPTDGRASLLCLTHKGQDAAQRISSCRTRRVARLLHDWSDSDIEQLALLLDRFVRGLPRSR